MTQPGLKESLRQLRQDAGYLHADDLALLDRAMELAPLWYGPLKKTFGDSFLRHPLRVASNLARLRLDAPSLVAGLLHQAVESKAVKAALVREKFGDETGLIIEGVSKLSEIGIHARKAEQVRRFRNMFLAMASDVRVILVKLADRLEMVESADAEAPSERRRDMAEEAMQIFAPIAGRLGIHWLKAALEDRAFAILEPAQCDAVRRHVEQGRSENVGRIDEFIHQLQALMAEHGIEAKVVGRAKHFYSIYRKMRLKQLSLDQIYDIVAFRVLVDTVEDCYKALGFVHATWRPIRGMFDDYIAMPKPNRYQSLHTTVVDAYGQRLEVQIRTKEMHEIAENGIAAHWRYKEGGAGFNPKDSERLAWVRQLVEVHEAGEEGGELLDQLRLDLFSDYIFVFTPKGDVHELPRESTPVDFAFSVHTQVGLRCSGAKVNNRMAPLHSPLQNGDVVSIFTTKTQKPKKEWLEFVKTDRAKQKIRHAIREEERDRSRELGREMVERACKDAGINWNKFQKEEAPKIVDALEELKCADLDDLYLKLGRGDLRVLEFIQRAAPDKIAPPAPERPQPAPEAAAKPRKSGKSGIKISGLDDLMLRFGRCCNPIQGDPVVGFVTRGRGITIHRADCPIMTTAEKERIIEAYWDMTSDFAGPVTIKVVCVDRAGLLAQMSNVFGAQKVNIESVQARTHEGRGEIYFVAHLKNMEQMERLRRELRRLKGVLYVERDASGLA